MATPWNQSVRRPRTPPPPWQVPAPRVTFRGEEPALWERALAGVFLVFFIVSATVTPCLYAGAVAGRLDAGVVAEEARRPLHQRDAKKTPDAGNGPGGFDNRACD